MIPPVQGCTRVDMSDMLSLPLGNMIDPLYVGVLFVEYNEGVIPIREERRRERKRRDDEGKWQRRRKEQERPHEKRKRGEDELEKKQAARLERQ